MGVLSSFVAIREQNKTKKMEKNAAEDANAQATEIARKANAAEADAKAKADEEAKKKLAQQTKTIFSTKFVKEDENSTLGKN